jgi:hypothetical protein
LGTGDEPNGRFDPGDDRQGVGEIRDDDDRQNETSKS